MTSKAALLATLDGSGQEHIVEGYEDLTADEQATLAAQITSFTNAQWRHMNSILRDSVAHLNQSSTAAEAANRRDAPCITPPPPETIFNLPRLMAKSSEELAPIYAAGIGVIARGAGAVLLMAGGSGTRLGANIPKGLFHCDLLGSGRSLFEYHCQRVRRVEQMAAAFGKRTAGTAFLASPSSSSEGRGLLTVLVMTSDQNDAATQSFFKKHRFFGLLPTQVLFFRQSSLPCYDAATGKALMEDKGRLCLSPSGNGGIYESLVRSPTADGGSASVLSQVEAKGVRYVQIFSVDNILAKLGDPYFFGIAAARQAEVVVKTVPKVSAEERVGVFALTNGEWGVVEYTEIGAERSAARDAATGELSFNCGNIASHCCTVDFLKAAAADMATSTLYHAARKTIATVKGPTPAIKLEAFIFDEFKLAKRVPTRRVATAEEAGQPDAFQIVQVDRSAEFAPIKNAEGAAADTATTAAHLVLKLHTKWVTEAIMSAPESMDGSENGLSTLPSLIPTSQHVEGYTVQDRRTALHRLREGVCQWEVCPLVSYEGEGLQALAVQLIRRSLAGEGVLTLEETAHGHANM